MDYFGNLREEMLKYVPANAQRILDVGCGGGRFGALLKAARPSTEVWGVEPEREAARDAASRLDRVLATPFDATTALPAAYFDAIVFNDSLEHFPDPFPPLMHCKSLLAAHGVIVCSIPNVRYISNLKHLLVDRDWRYEDFGVRDRTHLRFFTYRSILRTMDQAGFRVRSIAGINPAPLNWRKSAFLLLLYPWVSDTRFQQFAVVASPLGKDAEQQAAAAR